MRPAEEYHNARRMLIALLSQPDDGPVDISGLSEVDARFLGASCAATVLLYNICYTADFDANEAMKGVAALEMARHVEEICEL
jgi:hypothetical protein